MRCRHGHAFIAVATLLAPPRVVLSHGPHPATNGVVGLDVHAQSSSAAVRSRPPFPTTGPAPDDGSTTSHGFADLAVDAAGALHLVWLDPRDGAQGLRTSVSRDFGASWQPNLTLDARTCECCLNRLLAGAAETAVIYRDKEPRDMAVALTADGGRTWTRAGVAGAFGWEFEGCPEVGGALAARERAGRPEMHALVWTGQPARAGIHHLRSTDRGRTWDGNTRLGAEGARHLDLAASGGRLAAVWDETTAQGRVIRASVSDDGVTWRAAEALGAPAGKPSHPQVVATAPGRFLAVWTETDATGAVVWRAKAIG